MSDRTKMLKKEGCEAFQAALLEVGFADDEGDEAFWTHLQGCAACFDELAETRKLYAAYQEGTLPKEEPGFIDQVMTAVTELDAPSSDPESQDAATRRRNLRVLEGGGSPSSQTTLPQPVRARPWLPKPPHHSRLKSLGAVLVKVCACLMILLGGAMAGFVFGKEKGFSAGIERGLTLRELPSEPVAELSSHASTSGYGSPVIIDSHGEVFLLSPLPTEHLKQEPAPKIARAPVKATAASAGKNKPMEQPDSAVTFPLGDRTGIEVASTPSLAPEPGSKRVEDSENASRKWVPWAVMPGDGSPERPAFPRLSALGEARLEAGALRMHRNAPFSQLSGRSGSSKEPWYINPYSLKMEPEYMVQSLQLAESIPGLGEHASTQ